MQSSVRQLLRDIECGDPGEGWRSGPQSSWAEVSYCVIWVPVDVLSTPEASPEVLLSATELGLCASLLLLPSASSQLLRDSLAALLDLDAFLETASLALRPSKAAGSNPPAVPDPRRCLGDASARSRCFGGTASLPSG